MRRLSAFTILILILLTAFSCSNHNNGQPQNVCIIFDSSYLMTSYSESCVSANVLDKETPSESLIIDDDLALKEFQVLFDRMKDSCRVEYAGEMNGHSVPRAMIATYKDHADTLAFYDLTPDGIIACKDGYYRDSLLYYYSVYKLSDEDEVFTKRETALFVLDDLMAFGRYNHMSVMARNRYRHFICQKLEMKDMADPEDALLLSDAMPDSMMVFYPHKQITPRDYEGYDSAWIGREGYSRLKIDNPEELSGFRKAFNRMIEKGLQTIDSDPGARVPLMTVLVSYPDHVDTIAFLSLLPAGEIEVSNRVYVDSLIFYHTKRMIAEKDKRFYKSEIERLSADRRFYPVFDYLEKR